MRGSGTNTTKIAKFRSTEVSAPYILACEKPDANAKLVNYISFRETMSKDFYLGEAIFEWVTDAIELRGCSSLRGKKYSSCPPHAGSHTHQNDLILFFIFLPHLLVVLSPNLVTRRYS